MPLQITQLDECEKEPIQIPGAVQSHGVLMTLRSSDYTILQISESVFELFGIHHSELVHQPLSKLMPIDAIERATKRLGDRTPRLLNPIPMHIEVKGKVIPFDGILHRSGRALILELEKHVPEERGYGGFGGFYESVREVTSKMMITENLNEVLELGCQELRKLTGFSRVLVYKFDEDWNGEVINEAKDDEVDSYMHHHFPASDIPKQARELYTTNWLRIIPNVDYKPSKIVPPNNPITDKPLDLSNSVLRSVSPVHLEYMRNMGQMASMSVSLLKGKKLWGLIACHHPKPHYLKYDVRVAAEFIGQMVSAQIVAREEASEVDHKIHLKKLYDDLLKYGGNYNSIPTSFSQNTAQILGLVNAQGAALYFGERCVTIGVVPPAQDLGDVRQWVTSSKSGLVTVDEIQTLPGRDTPLDGSAAGILAINLMRETRDCIIWFRPERRETLKWAGDPSAAKFKGESGRIHPRKSFETWHQTVAGSSLRWRAADLEAAEELRTSILAMSVSNREPKSDPGQSFRTDLAQSIATTAATREGREPDRTEIVQYASASEAAQNSRLLLEGFAEFAVLFMNLDGCIQNWSAGAKRLLGFSKKEVLGKGLQMFFAEDDVLKEKHRRVVDYVREHGRCEEEMWLYRKDQTSFWGKIMVAQVRDELGAMIGFSIVIQDVTKEKAAEEELKATKLSAEAANRSKTAFLANISHEIRTPLGAVLGFSELMSAPGVADQERLELYGKVRRNGEQLSVLINDLLDISKVESGKIEIEKIEVDLNALLSDLEQLFTMKASEKGVRLMVELKGALPRKLVSDPTRLRQIVINLLSNAIKFTQSGGMVTLACSFEDVPHGRQLIFRVKDTGRGMTEAEMEKLFQPFVQADVSTTRMYGGTGLGLFLSQRLARALGGDLSIEWSEVGKGTTFLASIDPGEISEVETFSTLSHRSAAKPAFASRDLEGIRVLVVDDSPDNRELLTTYLKKAGAHVELASDGRSGVEAALKIRPDVCLMDIQMPVVDGNQAMKMLKEAGYAKPVVALTAHAMKEERDFSLAMGFSDYITKPIDRKLLLDRIFQLSKS